MPAFYKKDKCCTNCGKFGHLKRKCNEPIISLGIICFKRDFETDELLYLLVRRKHTIAFIDFIRGHYHLNDMGRLKYLFRYMTPNEKDLILKNDFYYIWKSIWLRTESKRFIKECNESVVKFNRIRNGYLNDYDDGTYVTFEYLINTNPSINDTPSWGFPKGRRNNYEIDIDTAQREFNEETGYIGSDYNVLGDMSKITEEFIGTNTFRYRYIYFVARCVSKYTPIIDSNNNFQITEIGDIKWVTYDDCINIFKRYQNTERRVELLSILHEKLLKRYPDKDIKTDPNSNIFKWNTNFKPVETIDIIDTKLIEDNPLIEDKKENEVTEHLDNLTFINIDNEGNEDDPELNIAIDLIK